MGKLYGREAAAKKRLTQIHEKAKMLRDYAKVCKRESIQSNRVRLEPKSPGNTDSKSTKVKTVNVLKPQVNGAKVVEEVVNKTNTEHTNKKRRNKVTNKKLGHQIHHLLDKIINTS